MEELNQSDDQDQAEDPEINPTHLAAVFGATDVPIFAYLGHALFEDPVFGGIVGLLVGGGTSLFLPSILQRSEDTDADVGADQHDGNDYQRGEINAQPTDLSDSTGGFHRTAAGFALIVTGIGLLSWRFVSDDILVGAGGALVGVALLYVVLSKALPQSLT